MNRSLRVLGLALFLTAAMAACSEAPPSAPPGTGIRGTVTLGPTCPVEQVGGPPCSTTYAATLAITRADDGTVVATVSSGDDGAFEALVPAGEYVIVPQPGGDPFPFGTPEQVTVVDGAFTEVVVSYDTGIR